MACSPERGTCRCSARQAASIEGGPETLRDNLARRCPKMDKDWPKSSNPPVGLAVESMTAHGRAIAQKV